MPATLAPELRDAVDYAMKVTYKWGSGRAADDYRQDALLALVAARVDKAKSDDERQHYLRRRATGAVIDAMRREMSQNLIPRYSEGLARNVDDAALESLQAPDDQTVVYDCRQIARRIDRMPAPLPYIAQQLAQGVEVFSIAKSLRMDPSRVSQLRTRIRKTLEAEATNDHQAHLLRRAIRRSEWPSPP